MPIEDIISTLKEESKQELEKLQKEKKKELDQVKEAYADRLKTKKKNLQKKLEEEFQSRRQSLEAKIHSNAQKRALEKKRELLGNFKADMQDKLKDLEGKKRKKLLLALVDKIPAEQGVLRGDKKSLSLLREASFGENIEISSEPLDTQGLYFIASEKEMDLTFKNLVDVIFENNEDTLNKILFTEQEAD